jgi:hypothetical protein
MLITSRFVVLNLPKTGSSFVRVVLKRIYRRRRWLLRSDTFLRELLLPRANGSLPGRDQHGTASQIPSIYRHLPAVSVIRNPYDKLLSAYEYRWWAEHPLLPLSELMELFPHYPDLSLDDFVDLWRKTAERRLGGANPTRFGHQTLQFVNFFFREPKDVLARFSDDYVGSGEFLRDMIPLTLLRQDRLREGLAAFLQDHGFTAPELRICLTHKQINVTAARSQPRQSLWTAKALDYVAHDERYLFAMLTRLGLAFSAPAGAT